MEDVPAAFWAKALALAIPGLDPTMSRKASSGGKTSSRPAVRYGAHPVLVQGLHQDRGPPAVPGPLQDPQTVLDQRPGVGHHRQNVRVVLLTGYGDVYGRHQPPGGIENRRAVATEEMQGLAEMLLGGHPHRLPLQQSGADAVRALRLLEPVGTLDEVHGARIGYNGLVADGFQNEAVPVHQVENDVLAPQVAVQPLQDRQGGLEQQGVLVEPPPQVRETEHLFPVDTVGVQVAV